MKPSAGEYSRPWSNICSRLTVGGRSIDAVCSLQSEDVAWRIEVNQDEIVICLQSGHGADITDDLLASLLGEVRACEDVGDCPFDRDRQLVLDSTLALKFIDDVVKAIMDGLPTCELLSKWDKMADACREAGTNYLVGLLSDSSVERSRLAQKAAIARHESSEFAEIRRVARECYVRWVERPNLYPSLAAFARDINDKFPDQMKNPVTVERWVRAWRREEF